MSKNGKLDRRRSGVLLHPTALPSRFGVGDLGPAAFAFVEYLAAARQTLWQVLPLGPTGFGDSPYSSPSAFAGNSLLIALEPLLQQDLLGEDDVAALTSLPADHVDFGNLPRSSAARWRPRSRVGGNVCGVRSRLSGLTIRSGWTTSRCSPLKDASSAVRGPTWEPGLRWREPSASPGPARCARDRLHKLRSFCSSSSGSACRRAAARSIEIMGDLPIFVAHDSADVWARPELFRLDADGQPTVIAGVPPDYFSATGQLWGNPHYRWDVCERTGYPGGSTAFAFCWRSSIESASITSGDSRRRGRCRLTRRRPYEVNG